jgi:hypothetical protein
VARWAETAAAGQTDAITLPISSLLPDAQVVIRARIDELAAKHTAVSQNRVQVSLAVALYYLVPGVGEAVDLRPSAISAQALLPGSALLPSVIQTTIGPSGTSLSAPVALPAVPARALCVQPWDKAEALQAVEAARGRGLNQVWLVLPDDGGDLLAAAIDAGKAARVSVWAVLQLLSRSPREPAEADRSLADINVLGETNAAYAARRRAMYRRGPGEGLRTTADEEVQATMDATYGVPRDWLRVDDPRATAHATEIARTPGLSGLVLTDTAAPGYVGQLHLGEAGDMGYSVDSRVAFVAQGEGDPIDLFDPERYDLLDLPFFPASGTGEAAAPLPNLSPQGDNAPHPLPREAWRDLCAGQNLSLMASVYEAIHRVGPSLPVLVCNRGDDPLYPVGWFGSWDRAQGLPDSSQEENASIPSASSAHAQCQRAFLSICWQNRSVKAAPRTVGEYAALIRGLLEGYTNRQDWDGIVFDFGALPVSRMVTLLKALTVVSEPR